MDRFRQEVKPGGLSSYPHPWLMPKFWQFPTVSMGLRSNNCQFIRLDLHEIFNQ